MSGLVIFGIVFILLICIVTIAMCGVYAIYSAKRYMETYIGW